MDNLKRIIAFFLCKAVSKLGDDDTADIPNATEGHLSVGYVQKPMRKELFIIRKRDIFAFVRVCAIYGVVITAVLPSDAVEKMHYPELFVKAFLT